jgi:hypothetical protein
MRSSRQSLQGLLALALLGTGASVVTAPPAQPTASVASAHAPGQPGNPMLPAPGQAAAPHDNRQWLRSRRTPSRYRSLRRSTGTHKQNRRRALAGR